jgi:hypothetical protein
MSKKSDQRRLKRARQAKAARDEERREVRRRVDRIVEDLRAACVDLADAARDDAVSPEGFAERAVALVSEPEWDIVLSDLDGVAEVGSEIGEVVDDERGRTLARALVGREAAAPLRTRLGWLAYGLADGSDDPDLFDEVATAVLARTDDADDVAGITSVLARVRVRSGRLGDALEMLDEACRTAPDHQGLQAARAYAMARTGRLLAGEDLDPVPGERGPVDADQLARAEAATARFADRSGLHRLWEAVDAHLAGDPALAAWVQAEVDEVLDEAREEGGLGPLDRLGGGPLHLAALEAEASGTVDDPSRPIALLAAERAWLTGPDDGLDPDEDVPAERTVLGRVAADPSTPPPVADAARSWLEHVRYGLWQPQLPPPDDPAVPRPSGTWVTDLATRQVLYAAIPAGQLDGLARWSVLAGPIGPVDGVWRTGGAMVVLDPGLADRAAESVLTVTERVVAALAREHGMREPVPERSTGDRPDPHGVLADVLDPVEDSYADLIAKVLGSSLANLIGMVEASSRAPLGLSNTDGDPLEVLAAVYPCVDPLEVRGRLLAGGPFEAGDAEERSRGELAPPLRWLGREMTASEAASSLATVQAQLRAQGLEPVEAPDGPQRWLRGSLRFEVGRIRAEVNSRARLETLTAELRAAGLDAAPTVTTQLDPAMDLPTAGRRIGGGSMDPAGEEVWRTTWLDTPLPALGGLTPRAASARADTGVLVESLLRTIEHDADVAAAAGGRPMDVDALRVALGMTDGVWGLDEAVADGG